MFIPKKTKYRKIQKGILPNTARSQKDNIFFGRFALKSTNFGVITSKQLEAGKKVITKKIKKKGKLWVRIFPHLSKTKKPIEVRMGKGKGSVDSWIIKIKPGTIIYEIEGLSFKAASDVFLASSRKLSVKCKIEN